MYLIMYLKLNIYIFYKFNDYKMYNASNRMGEDLFK